MNKKISSFAVILLALTLTSACSSKPKDTPKTREAKIKSLTKQSQDAFKPILVESGVDPAKAEVDAKEIVAV